jgi:hypothetical protein
MTALLNWRVWVALALAAVLAFTHFTAYRKGKNDVRTEWMASVAAANEMPAAWSERARAVRMKLHELPPAREARLRADAARARRESDGLRGNLDAAVQYAAKSRAAAERTAGLATDLLGRCTALYLGVAEAAARADSEARELRSAWPTN